MSMVDLYFPLSTGVSIIAEPGSFFVSSAFTLAVNIISKEVVARDRQKQAHGQSIVTFTDAFCNVSPTAVPKTTMQISESQAVI